MINASEYDIEINGDRMYLYRPLLPTNKLHDIVQKGTLIKQKLLNNIVTYRDERLPVNEGRKDVAIYGNQLRLNSFRQLPVLLIGIALLSVGIYGYISGASIVNQGIVFGVMLSISAMWSIGLAWYKNRLLDEYYRESMKTNNGKQI